MVIAPVAEDALKKPWLGLGKIHVFMGKMVGKWWEILYQWQILADLPSCLIARGIDLKP